MSERFITFSLFLVLCLGIASCEKSQDVVMEEEEAVEAVAEESIGSPTEEAAAIDEGADEVEITVDDTDEEMEEAVEEVDEGVDEDAAE